MDTQLKLLGRDHPLTEQPPIKHLKPSIDPATLFYRQLLDGAFWQRIPAYRLVDEATFLDHTWQARHTITNPQKLLQAVQDLVPQAFYDDVAKGFHLAPMSIRVSPYLLSLIDWADAYNDPLRRQFVPLASRLLPDHPKLTLDSLHEQADAPVPGLTHRYPDKALFLALDTCPVYCRFCTRSYAVGVDTDEVEKVSLKATEDRWERAFRYISERPELEDIVVSGGDSYQLKARQIALIGNRLLELPNIRRIRFATKGPAVMPMKLLTDHEWLDALTSVVERGRKAHKEVVLHTHFNHPDHQARARQRVRARDRRAQPVRAAARGQRLGRDHAAPGQAARTLPGPALLRLPPRPGEGRRGPADHAADRARPREGGARRDRRLPDPDVRGRRAGRRRQARRVQLRALRSRHRHLGVLRTVGQAGLLPVLRSGRHAGPGDPGPVEEPRRAGSDDRGCDRARKGEPAGERAGVERALRFCAVAVGRVPARTYEACTIN
jgi:KamA family protein